MIWRKMIRYDHPIGMMFCIYACVNVVFLRSSNIILCVSYNMLKCSVIEIECRMCSPTSLFLKHCGVRSRLEGKVDFNVTYIRQNLGARKKKMKFL